MDRTAIGPADRSARARAEAFDAWARGSGPALLRYATAVTGNPHDGADRVQDALAAVFPRWVRLSAEGAADAYARKVITNRSVSRWRKIGRRERPLESAGRGAEPSVDGVDTRVADVLLARDLLTELTTLQRAAVVLRFYLDCDFAEIGETLSCRESTARSHVHRALARLRDRLTEADDHD